MSDFGMVSNQFFVFKLFREMALVFFANIFKQFLANEAIYYIKQDEHFSTVNKFNMETLSLDMN